MGNGIIIIITDHAGIADIVEDGVNGELKKTQEGVLDVTFQGILGLTIAEISDMCNKIVRNTKDNFRRKVIWNRGRGLFAMSKKKVLFMTNYPAPYRVDFFNELGKKCDLTVTFEESPDMQKHRSAAWFSKEYINFNAVFLKNTIKWKGHVLFSTQIIGEIKKKYDVVIVGVYSTGTSILAIAYMKLHKIPYWIESDGGMIKWDEKRIKKKFKTLLISDAEGYFSPSSGADEYLAYYGADRRKIHRYPFTSLSTRDIANALLVSDEQKEIIKSKLKISEKRVLLSVGKFSNNNGYEKDYETLLKMAENLPHDIGIYIISNDPTMESVACKKKKSLDHVHFVGIKKKVELAEYYATADAFLLLTKGNLWSIAINDAISFGLPVISTYQCVAGKELIKEGINGYLVDAGDSENVEKVIKRLFEKNEHDYKEMRLNCLEMIKDYSIESMTVEHMSVIRAGTREILNISEKFMVLYVGQIIHRKGIDILLEAANRFPDEIGLYLIGGNPTDEYLKLIEKHEGKNVHVIGFKNKTELDYYYRAADVFVLPTREDIWGLVINEAMTYALPCISTNQCGAALELIDDGRNGYRIDKINADSLYNAIINLYKDNKDVCAMRLNCLKKISGYTIESMAQAHTEVLILE